MSRKIKTEPTKDWYQYPEVENIKIKKQLQVEHSNNAETECVAVMLANGGAPHYM